MNIKQSKRELISFFLVGCVNVFVGTVTMFTAYYVFFLGYWISSALNYIISSICSYFLNRKFTFHNKDTSWEVPVRFTINIIMCWLLAYSVAKPLTLALFQSINPSFAEFAAMLVGMVLFSILNYFGQSKFVFRSRRLGPSDIRTA